MSLVWINRLMVFVGVVFFGGGAAFHGAALIWPSLSEPMPPLTHAAFVVINLFFAVAFVLKVSWVQWPFLLLTAQQLWSHGGDLVRALLEKPPRLDGQSLFALFGIGLIWLLLWARGKASKAAFAPGV